MENIELEFEILGKVKAKQSVKFTKSGMRYTPKDVVTYANWVRNCFIMTFPEHSPEVLKDYYIAIEITANFVVPSSFSKKKREAALNGLIRPAVKPDWDNLSKNICDALNGIAYPDDKAIVHGEVKKFYALKDSVFVRIEAWKPEL